MEGYTYTNIFETKGIEYIIIIVFFLILIPFRIIANKPQMKKGIHAAVKALTMKALRIPQGLFYSKNHTWAYLEKSGDVKIGIDDFLVHLVGAFKLNLVRIDGETIHKGEIMAEINQQEKRLKILAPVSGVIINSNLEAAENTEMVKSDPYNNGWLYSIQPIKWKTEISGFYFAEGAVKWIETELQRFRDFLSTALSKNSETTLPVFQEGGELLMDPLEGLAPGIWNDFQNEFLNHTD